MSTNHAAGMLQLTPELIEAYKKEIVTISQMFALSANENGSRETLSKLDPIKNFKKADSTSGESYYNSAIVPILTKKNIPGKGLVSVHKAKVVKFGINEIKVFPYISSNNMKDGRPVDEKFILWLPVSAKDDRVEFDKEAFGIVRDSIAIMLNDIYCVDPNQKEEYMSTLTTIGDVIAIDQHAADKGILPLPTVEETKLNFAISRNFSLIFGHLMSVIEAKVTGNLIMNIEQEKTFESCSKEVFETMKTITNIYPTVNYNRSNRMTINPGQTITTGGLNQYTPVAGPVSGVSVKR